MAHLLFAQLLGPRLDARAFRLRAVQGADCLNAAQQLHHGAVHIRLGFHQLHADALLRADLPKDDERAHGNHQHDQAGHGGGQLREDRDHRRQPGGHRGSEVHEHQLDQLDGALQAAVEAAMDIAGHVGAEIGQRSHQQRERGPLARGFFRLGGGVLHDEPARYLDELVDDVDDQDGHQNRRDRGKRGLLPRQHMVRQVADGQGRQLAEHRRDAQNQQNQKEAELLLPGQQGEDVFPDFPAGFRHLHNAHDPFHVAAGEACPYHFTTFRGS